MDFGELVKISFENTSNHTISLDSCDASSMKNNNKFRILQNGCPVKDWIYASENLTDLEFNLFRFRNDRNRIKISCSVLLCQEKVLDF